MKKNNYFANRNLITRQKKELWEKLYALLEKEEDLRDDYLTSVASAIEEKPGLTADQYAMMLADDADERYSIACSISMLGFMAEDTRRYDGQHLCKEPSLPELTRKMKTFKRHFIEVNSEGNPIGRFDTEEQKFTYSMGR